MNSIASPAICWATSRSANPLMSRHITLFALWLLPLWACAGNDASGPRYLIEQGASANVLQVRLTMQGKPPFTLLPARQLPGSVPRRFPPRWSALQTTSRLPSTNPSLARRSAGRSRSHRLRQRVRMPRPNSRFCSLPTSGY